MPFEGDGVEIPAIHVKPLGWLWSAIPYHPAGSSSLSGSRLKKHKIDSNGNVTKDNVINHEPVIPILRNVGIAMPLAPILDGEHTHKNGDAWGMVQMAYQQ